MAASNRHRNTARHPEGVPNPTTRASDAAVDEVLSGPLEGRAPMAEEGDLVAGSASKRSYSASRSSCLLVFQSLCEGS